MPTPPPPPSSLSPFEIRSPRRPMWSHTGSPFPHRPSKRKLRKSNVQKLVASYAKVYPSIPTGTRSTQVEKEVCVLGTTRLWFCMRCVSEHGDGWATGGIWHSPGHGPLASSTRTRSAPAAGPRGMDQPSTTLPAARRGRDASVAIFEPYGLSSRSCCSTGRLMRRLSPIWWGWWPI